MPPESTTEIPLPLPAGLPARLAMDHKIILFSDYDGTLSEITPDIANAQPLPGVDQLIERLVARPDRFRVVADQWPSDRKAGPPARRIARYHLCG